MTHCSEDSTSQSNFGCRVVDGEGFRVAILLDDAHGYEEISPGQAQIAQGFRGGKVE